MIEIDSVLISSEIMTERFVCNLNACKGACCWEGDYGAPVTDAEKEEIESNLPKILEGLSTESIAKISTAGAFEYYGDDEKWGTNLQEDGACVFMTKDEFGIAKCGIEASYNKGDSTIKKPISCHLYPIRVLKYEEQGFESWNYDQWDICSAACSLGDQLKVPVFQFVKDAIVRYKGAAFFDQLNAAADHIKSQDITEHN